MIIAEYFEINDLSYSSYDGMIVISFIYKHQYSTGLYHPRKVDELMFL